MTALEDILELESNDWRTNLASFGDLRAAADGVVWYCFQLEHAGDSVGTKSASSLARLLIDACVHVEQSLVCLARGQPRLAWASLRIAAEALKDLDAIDRHPPLHALWLEVGRHGEVDTVKTALNAFSKERGKVPRSTVTELCSATITIASHLGAHPNATSHGSLGPMEVDEHTVSLPARLRDPNTLLFHARSIIYHAMNLLLAVTEFRLKFLSPSECDDLNAKCTSVFKTVQRAYPDSSMEVYDA